MESEKQMPVVEENKAVSARRVAWETFIQTGILDEEKISPLVAQWWRRSRELGVDPYRVLAHDRLTFAELAERKAQRKEMLVFLRPVVDHLLDTLGENPYVLAVADHEGYLLEIAGDPEILKSQDQMAFYVGANHSEKYMGNNPIGTTLYQGEPVYIQGGEHYNRLMKGWTSVGIPIHDRIGKILGAVGFSVPNRYANINLFLTAIFAIQAMENRLIFSSNPEMEGIREHFYQKSTLFITVLDKDGRIKDFNRETSAISGKRREELIGKYIWDVWYGGKMHKEDGSYCAYSVESLMTGRYIRGKEFSLKDREGRPRWFLIDSFPLYDGQGHISGSMSILEDITEQKYLENQIYRSEKLATLGQLAASLAHEIRNPLTVIKGFIQMLEEHYGDESMREYLPLVMEELERVNRLLSDFLSFAKPTAPMIKDTDMRRLVESVADFMHGETERCQCPLEIRLKGNLFNVRVDEQQIRQVLVNLIQNAIDATPDGGPILITLDGTRMDCLYLSVEDKGGGIGEENLAKVFDPFFTTKDNGTGLGLYAVHRIVDNHGGQVDIRSIQGEGTTIDIRLPFTMPVASIPQ